MFRSSTTESPTAAPAPKPRRRKPPRASKELRTRYEKIVMCIARDDAPKRMDLFLDTAARFPQYAFVWVGNGRDYDKPDNAVLLGRIPMADRLLDQTDLFMLCSDFEGLPMSIIEALSHGKPVVASAVGGIAELLDGTNGHAVENRRRHLPKRSEAIFADNGRYETMSHAAAPHTSGRSPSTAWRTDIGKYTIGSIGNNNMNITLIGGSGFVGTRLLGLLGEQPEKYTLRNIDKRQSHFFPT